MDYSFNHTFEDESYDENEYKDEEKYNLDVENYNYFTHTKNMGKCGYCNKEGEIKNAEDVGYELISMYEQFPTCVFRGYGVLINEYGDKEVCEQYMHPECVNTQFIPRISCYYCNQIKIKTELVPIGQYYKCANNCVLFQDTEKAAILSSLEQTKKEFIKSGIKFDLATQLRLENLQNNSEINNFQNQNPYFDKESNYKEKINFSRNKENNSRNNYYPEYESNPNKNNFGRKNSSFRGGNNSSQKKYNYSREKEIEFHRKNKNEPFIKDNNFPRDSFRGRDFFRGRESFRGRNNYFRGRSGRY